MLKLYASKINKVSEIICNIKKNFKYYFLLSYFNKLISHCSLLNMKGK